MIRKFKTNLRCQACEHAIKPLFDDAPGVTRWSIDLGSPDKPLTVEGDISESEVAKLLEKAGYRSLGELTEPRPSTPAVEQPASYFPLALIIAYILGVVGLIELTFGPFDEMRAMSNFMAGFFLVFSFFKMLDVPAFAASFAMYDLIAHRSRVFALAYPFIELALGVAYLTRVQPMLVNAVTLVIMAIGTLGIVRSLMVKQKIQCACLGTVFNLPMSVVTLVEDGAMVLMAGYMLIRGS